MAAPRKNPTMPEIGKNIVQELAVLNATVSARFDSIEEKIAHQSDLIDERLKPVSDHEIRIRHLEDAIGALKVKYDWLTGGSLAASVASILKSFLGM